MSIELFESRQILVKIETTEGTEAVPAGATDAVLTFNGSVQVDSDKLERPYDAAYFHANPFVLVNRRVTIQYEIEMLGAATVGAAAPVGPILRICGMGQTLSAGVSATYAPITDAIVSATHHFNHGGVLFKALGCRANIEWEWMVDGYCKGKVTVTGLAALSDLPSAVAAVATTLTAFRQPPAIDADNWTVSLNSVALECTKITLNQGADVQIHHHSEGRVAKIMARKPSGVLTCYLPDLTVINPWTLAGNHTLVPISSVINGGASKIITLAGSTLQLEMPKTIDLKKGMGLEIPFTPQATSGNDEFSWTFT